jgi:hypothetical protein
MRIRLLILLILIFTIEIFSQENEPIKWIVRPSFGYTLPIANLNSGYITDNLVGFDSPTYYWQFISTTYFFSNWGIEFSFAANHCSNLNNRHDKFISDVEKKYSEDFFVTTGSGASYSDFNIVGGSIEKGSIGPVYKIEHNKLIFIGRAMIGVTSFDTDHGNCNLKGKGTNERINIGWTTGRPVKDNFSFNPSLSFGYRLHKRIAFDFDINYWIYNINFEYTETIKNFNTNKIQTQKYTYSNLINEFSIGMGLMIILK